MGFRSPTSAGGTPVADVSLALADADLWPTCQPEWKGSVDYRRWAFESAALDLALRQARTTLGAVLERDYAPVRFAVSGGFGSCRVARRSTVRSSFKLDVSATWDEQLMRGFAQTGRVRVLDFKAYYEASQVETIDDPERYARVAAIFPEAILEDAALNDQTLPALDGALDRLSFDAPIHSLDDVLGLTIEPKFLNIKPSRFGTVEGLFECIDWCLANGVSMYGGGPGSSSARGGSRSRRWPASSTPTPPPTWRPATSTPRPSLAWAYRRTRSRCQPALAGCRSFRSEPRSCRPVQRPESDRQNPSAERVSPSAQRMTATFSIA